LAGRLPRPLRRRPQRLAIDLTLIPYHGDHFRDPAEVYRSLARDGTSHSHLYATAYVVLPGRRFTVALTAVTKGEPLKGVVRRLLRQARSVGVRPRRRLLDRGFYSVGVIRYLQAARCPFLMPARLRGKTADDPGDPRFRSRVVRYAGFEQRRRPPTNSSARQGRWWSCSPATPSTDGDADIPPATASRMLPRSTTSGSRAPP
jgi:putative transposase